MSSKKQNLLWINLGTNATDAINFYADTRLKGVQTGWVNYARRFTGVQLGLVNFAETAEAGLQVGIVNVMRKNRWFGEFPDAVAPGMVLVNWRF